MGSWIYTNLRRAHSFLSGSLWSRPEGGKDIGSLPDNVNGGSLMRMVKSLLLGSAAGLVAVAGAQAADLPVKAKPVEYVKICSLYGVGFYYIPGTDMCIKIGGYVRFETAWNTNGSSTRTQGGDLNNRFSNELWYRVRGYITADARNQTEYGTVRGYLAVGILTDTSFDPPQTFNANRAF